MLELLEKHQQPVEVELLVVATMVGDHVFILAESNSQHGGSHRS